ncbi:MAG: deoxyribonuclease IV [Thermoleophilia bacterium]|nr:deoxyribonuclease IV [Thermoleophilia bacterium]
MPPIGAQVSAAGGLPNAIIRARAIGAEAVQLFPSNPRQWRPFIYSDGDLSDFGTRLRRAGLPLFIHTIYLINLASPDATLRKRSTVALTQALVFAARTAASGVVTHIGSHRGDGFRTALRRVTRAIEEALTRAAEATEPPIPPLLLETSAGGGDSLGRSPAELGELVSAFPTRLGVCLDSAHLFAGGYSVHTEAGLAELVTELRREALLERVGLVHLNDCKTPLGSYADRHENLWEGLLGRAGLRTFMAQPAFRHVPFVLEVPGFAGHGPDSRNMRRARILRREVSAA